MNYSRVSDEKVKVATGKSWKQWFAILKRWGAKEKDHYLTAKYLKSRYKLSGWWSQVVTIRYEKERGYWERHNK